MQYIFILSCKTIKAHLFYCFKCIISVHVLINDLFFIECLYHIKMSIHLYFSYIRILCDSIYIDRAKIESNLPLISLIIHL
jgi:hypothetical protein